MERLQVKEEKLKVLTVTVVRASGVSDSWHNKCLRSRLCPCIKSHTVPIIAPDPYVILRVSTSPNAKQKTKVEHDKVNPEWNEIFQFYLNPDKKNTLELTMMDEDFGKDDMIGMQNVELDDLPVEEEIRKEIRFDERTMLEIILLLNFNETKQLRCSYDLCEDEKDFLKKRRKAILQKMPRVLGEESSPRTVDEVPTIVVMGSGGGYRAACGLSGVFCALEETGILDCATYVTGLSGSSWYISTLYSHDEWPNNETCEEMARELRKRFNKSVLSHVRTGFLKRLEKKLKFGQPVGFTDLFGMMIGDALLRDKDTKLSYQVRKVIDGQTPLPVTTGIRVSKGKSADVFSEWVEFTPFEFGMAKYGVFGKTSEFGAKYYKGRLVTQCEESPLDYLLGIWGSAFSILLNRVVDIETKMKKFEETAAEQLAREVIKEAERLKKEDEDSEDEDLAEDEIKISENWLSEMLKPANLFASRRGKAAEIFNVCRGLQFRKGQDEEFDNSVGKQKTMCVVDSGIAFNSPFPAMLRPERKVDLILSFDFSQKDNGDKELPFVELIKAEKWARDNGLPFPQVEGNPVTEDPNLQECYVFEDANDVTCPTILHFPIINKTFRNYLKPGVPRETKEDKNFADFGIFDDPNEPYSSFKFQYDYKAFDRLHQLMKFNTLLNMDLIKENIAKYVFHKRNSSLNQHN